MRIATGYGVLFCLLAAACLLPACSDDDPAPVGQGPTDTEMLYDYFNPDGVGTLQILTYGGQGLSGDGGAAGTFEIYANSSGDIMVLPNGTIDTSFDVPATMPELGSNVRTISTDTTLQPEQGTYTIVGDDGQTIATGLHVLAGATLTLLPNYDMGSDGSLDRVRLNFADGVLIEGTIVIGRVEITQVAQMTGTRDTASFYLNADNIVTTSTAVIDSHGVDGIYGERGGNGGEIDWNSRGTLINRGAIRCYGGVGTDGGHGGNCEFSSSSYAIFNTGPVLAYGGVATARTGGNGGEINWDTDGQGGIFSSGDIDCRGANGTGGGGEGGDVDFDVYYLGAFVSSGDINASAGNATNDGDGGRGGYIEVDVGGGHIRVTGNLSTYGGNGRGEGNGGDGDYVEFYLQDNDYIEGDYSLGGMFIGANIHAYGGDGVNGGSGGNAYFYPDQDEVFLPGTQVTILAGYAGIDASGGNGTVDGGNASDEGEVFNDGAYDYNGDYSVGSILFEVDIDISGGNGGTGHGGDGGDFEIANYEYYGTPPFDREVCNTADFMMAGGNGGTYGGDGGDFFMYDYFCVVNEGNLDTSGGNGFAEQGGDGGNVEVCSDTVCECRGNLDSSGGNGSSVSGGSGGDVWIAGRMTFCYGDIDASGGDCVSAEGGDGGDIDIYSTDTLTEGSGHVYVEAGGGDTDGEDGEVWLDGIKVDLTAGSGDL